MLSAHGLTLSSRTCRHHSVGWHSNTMRKTAIQCVTSIVIVTVTVSGCHADRHGVYSLTLTVAIKHIVQQAFPLCLLQQVIQPYCWACWLLWILSVNEAIKSSEPFSKIILKLVDKLGNDRHLYKEQLVSDIAIFVLKRDVKLQLTN